MPRYDLMHWSVRVRDQQAAHPRAVAPAPVVAPPPVERPRKTRVARPKPPRNEDADHLLRLCREGRLFELQAWIAAGRPLKVPAYYRHTPLHVAVDSGFHSLIELLLQHENDQAVKDDAHHSHSANRCTSNASFASPRRWRQGPPRLVRHRDARVRIASSHVVGGSTRSRRVTSTCCTASCRTAVQRSSQARTASQSIESTSARLITQPPRDVAARDWGCRQRVNAEIISTCGDERGSVASK